MILIYPQHFKYATIKQGEALLMNNKKIKEHNDLNDLKKANNEAIDLYKEIKKEAKSNRNRIALDALDRLNLDIDFKSVVILNLDGAGIDDEMTLTSFIKQALFDAKELLNKGTEYGVQLAINRIENMVSDRKIAKSPFLVKEYAKFEKDLWTIIKLRELAYGEIYRLKQKQDDISKTALREADPMMRVRYFEDIRVLEKDILRLENEAHRYDTVQATLHSDEVLKNVLQQYSTSKKENLEITKFEETVNQYGRK